MNIFSLGLCQHPISILNVYTQQLPNIIVPGALAHYYCKPRFNLTGEVSRECLSNGSWSLPVPQCISKYDYVT